jgi:hypothetical protein
VCVCVCAKHEISCERAFFHSGVIPVGNKISFSCRFCVRLRRHDIDLENFCERVSERKTRRSHCTFTDMLHSTLNFDTSFFVVIYMPSLGDTHR